MYSEDDMLMLSGIQHYRFCPRQWALIHLEQQWDDNRLTIEGQLLHKHVDGPFYRQKCGEHIMLRAVHVAQLMIAAKIQNYRNILRRYIRDYGDCQEVESAVKTLDLNKQYALKAEDKAKLMGFEGIASHAYFEVLPKLWTEGAELCI